MSKVGIIESEKMTNGINLMKDNTNLRIVDTRFPILKHANYMFRDCSSLTSFCSGGAYLDDYGCTQLTNGTEMFYGCSKLKNIYYTSLGCLITGDRMFMGCLSLETFDNGSITQNPIKMMDNLIDANEMFRDCSSLTSFNSSIKNIINANGMFYNCSSLSSFVAEYDDTKIGTLTNSEYMFYNCNNLQNIEWIGSAGNVSDKGFSGLVDACYMFSHTGIESFDYPLSSLKYANNMFYNCTSLTSVAFNDENSYSGLQELINGTRMFYNCINLNHLAGMRYDYYGTYCYNFEKLEEGQEMFSSTAFESFYGNLPNLVNGRCMFNNCSNLSVFVTGRPTGLENLKIGENMFSGCVLNKMSIIELVKCLKNTKITETADITIGADIVNKDDADIVNALNLNEDKSLGFVKSINDGTWNVIMEWNTK